MCAHFSIASRLLLLCQQKKLLLRRYRSNRCPASTIEFRSLSLLLIYSSVCFSLETVEWFFVALFEILIVLLFYFILLKLLHQSQSRESVLVLFSAKLQKIESTSRPSTRTEERELSQDMRLRACDHERSFSWK